MSTPQKNAEAAGYRLREAAEADLNELLRLEKTCFTEDRLSRRSFRHFIEARTAALIVATADDQQLAGYALILLHRGTSLARLYSIAVDPAVRGAGLGELLMQGAEAAARDRHRAYLRLEVRTDNAAAIRLYERLGYKQFGSISNYYEDHQDALRYQKRVLRGAPSPMRDTLRYYPQSTNFTCGPAALMMAMNALDPGQELDRSHELQLWRESTTIYMTTGHGGCSPLGLALAALKRGFQASIIANQPGPYFVDSVRAADKKAVVELVHNDFVQELARFPNALTLREPGLADIEKALAKSQMVLALISTWHFDYKKTPHWVLISGIDEYFVYIHDPFIDAEDLRYDVDNQYLPIARDRFMKMSCFGQSRLRVFVTIGPPPA